MCLCQCLCFQAEVLSRAIEWHSYHRLQNPQQLTSLNPAGAMNTSSAFNSYQSIPSHVRGLTANGASWKEEGWFYSYSGVTL